MSEPLATALERQAATPEAKTVRDLIERMAPELEKALPAQLGVERFTRTVLTELRRTPKLYDCHPESLLGAMMLAAQLGLEPGPLGHVYLVPFKHQVEFIIGYRGYIELAFRSGQLKDIAAHLVHEGDHFEFRHGTRPFLDHVPSGPPEERPIVAAYAVARLKTGGAPFQPIYEADWERARKRSASGAKNVGPWNDDQAMMIRKTSVRRLESVLPKTPDFMRAVERDDAPAPVFEEGALSAPEPEEAAE